MLCGGLLLGVVYDVCRVIGEQFRFPRWLVAAIDLIYWIAACVLIFRMLYVSNSGEVRLYVFIGLAVGVWAYTLLFSSLTERIVLRAIRIYRAIIVTLQRLGHHLVVRPVKALYRLLLILLGFLGAFTIFLSRFVVQLTYPIVRFLLWLARLTRLDQLFKPIIRWLTGKFGQRR